MTETGYSMYLQAIISLGFVIGLILISAKIMKNYIDPTARSNAKRLSVSEALNIDGRNRLLIIKRDDVEHLVMIGGGQNTIIEKDIPASSAKPDETKSQKEN